MNRRKNLLYSLLFAMAGGPSLIFFFFPIRNVPIYLLVAVVALLTPVFFLVVSGWAFEPYRNRSQNTRRWIATGFVLLTTILLISIKGEQFHLQDNRFATVALVYLGCFSTLLAGLLVAVRFLLQFGTPLENVPVTKWKILLYALPAVAVWMVYLVAYYPAVMTTDSVFQWEQVQTRKFTDWHPAMHTWLILLLTRIWNSPAMVALAQILVLAMIIGYCVYRLEGYGVKKPILYGVLALFVLIPINGIYTVTLWKDILYSAMIMLFTMYLFNLVVTKGEWINNNWNLLLFLLASAGVVFFRHNGFAVFVATMVIWALVYRFRMIRVHVAALVVVILYFLVTGPVYTYFNVTPADPNEKYAVPIQQLGAIIAYNGTMTEQQKQFLNQILPIDVWKQKYSPYIADPIKGHPDYNRTFLYAHKAEYFRTWIELVLQNPSLAWNSYLKLSSLVWQINTPQDGYTYTFSLNTGSDVLAAKAERFGIDLKSLNQSITRILLETKTELPLIWRPATYSFLIALLLFAIVIRNNRRVLLIALPWFWNNAAIAAALPAQDFRYLYANLLVLFVVLPVSFVLFEKQDGGASA